MGLLKWDGGSNFYKINFFLYLVINNLILLIYYTEYIFEENNICSALYK